MKEQFVTFEIALKLKELGFDECCLAVYFKNKFQLVKGFNINNVDLHVANEIDAILAPLWQQVIDWFREKFKYHIEIQSPDYQNENDFYWTIHVVKKIGVFGDGSSDNYYEAREQAILKAIELCQKEK